MAYEFKLPDVGEGIEEAQVLKWMLDVGDGVREDDPIAEVETDKAIIEVPSPVDGEVRRLHADEGETVEVGDPFVTFERGDGGRDARNDGGVEILDSDGNAAVDVDAEGSEKETSVDGGEEETETSEATRRLAREIGVDPDDVEGSGKDGRVLAQDILHAAKEEQEEREEERGEEDNEDDEPTDEDTDTDTVIPGKGGKTPTMEDDETTPEFGQDQTPAVDPDTAEETSMFGDETPVTERTDEHEEVGDTGEEEGTEADEEGPEPANKENRREEDGSETEATGEDAGTDAETDTAVTDTTETVTSKTTTGTAVEDEETIDEGKMTDTGTTPGTSEEAAETGGSSEGDGVEEVAEEAVPAESASAKRHMTHRDVADAERLSEVKEELHEAVDTRLTYTPLLVKACAEALDGSVFLEVSDGIDIGVGVDGDDGVVVGVVENADGKGIKEIAVETAELRDGVRSDDGDDVEEATLTLLDIGAVGGESVSPVVGLPGDAAVSVGEIRLRPSVVNGEVVPRHTAPLSVTFDGGVADPVEAARFTNELKRYLSQPSVILLR